MTRRELPYDFDLLYDIKTLYEVGMIAKGEPHCSNASPEDLVELFQKLEMPVPECLAGVVPMKDIWVHRNGTWIDYEPLLEERDSYRKARIHGF